MKDTKNLTIAALCVSATILATVLVLMDVSGQAYADAPTRGGEYVAVTGAFSRSTDILYVLDLRVQKINAYVYDRQNKTISRADQVDLRRAFAAK